MLYSRRNNYCKRVSAASLNIHYSIDGHTITTIGSSDVDENMCGIFTWIHNINHYIIAKYTIRYNQYVANQIVIL